MNSPPIVPTPAANARSPNRKPRTRKRLEQYTRALHKAAVIGAFLNGAELEQAAAAGMVSPGAVLHWAERDPEFREQAKKARELARLRAEGKLTDGLEQMVERLVTILQNTTDEALSVDGIIKVLRGVGVLVDRQQAEIKGLPPQVDNRRLIVNILGNADSREAAIRLARALESGAGGDSGEVGPGGVAADGTSGLPES